MTTQDIKTTTLIIDKPADFGPLNQAFTLARYVVPAYIGTDYKLMHICLQEQLTVPYRTFNYDEIDGAKQCVVYALFRPGEELPGIVFNRNLDDETRLEPIQPRVIQFQEIVFHMTLKLLLAAYFRGNRRVFTGEGKHYLHVRSTGEHWDICLEIDLRGHPDNKESHTKHIFHVDSGATRFARVTDIHYVNPATKAYFDRTIGRDGLARYAQLHRRQIIVRLNEQGVLWEHRPIKDAPARLNFFDLEQLEASRGYMLHEFCTTFLEFLAKYGIDAHLQTRSFQVYEPGSELDLNLDGKTIFVLDIRQNQAQIPLTHYLTRFSARYPEICFQAITLAQIENTIAGPVIVVQDNIGDSGGTDPYVLLYEEYPNIPKQTITVNPDCGSANTENVVTEGIPTYPALAFDDEDKYGNRLDIAVRDALLKHLLLRPIPAEDILPDAQALANYTFLRRAWYRNDHYTALLQFHDGEIQVQGLRNGRERTRLYDTCDEYGLDWDAVYENMMKWRQKTADARNPGDEIPFFEVVLGPGLALDLVDSAEYALYDFPAIIQRQRGLSEVLPIDDFRLLPHFDDLRKSGWPSRSEIESTYLELPENSFTTRQQEAVVLYRQLTQYESFLNHLEKRCSHVSFSGLKHDYIADITPIISWRRLWNVYKRIGKFLGPRQSDVVYYQGMWYDPSDNSYMVGGSDGIEQKQARANAIRRFRVIASGKVGIMPDMMELMAVGFVRLRQYTVVPYPFKLLRLYVENRLYWEAMDT